MRSFRVVAVCCALSVVAPSAAAARDPTSSPGVLAKALISSPLQDARLSPFGHAEASAAGIPGLVGSVKFRFAPSGASILYAVGNWPDDLYEPLTEAATVGSIQTTRPGPKWLPGRSVVATSSGVSPKGWITEVVFTEGVVGMVAVNPSAAAPTSADVAAALALARVALDHLHSVERDVDWRPASLANIYRAPSSSMEPTLHCSRPGSGCEAASADHVRAKPLGSQLPVRGEILVFKTPPAAQQQCGAGGTFIKRLIGLPGETIQEKRGLIFINGRRLNEPYVKPHLRDSESQILGKTRAYRIPNGMYFLMGDARIQSCDSREWGPVPLKNILGRVVEILRGDKVIPIH